MSFTDLKLNRFLIKTDDSNNSNNSEASNEMSVEQASANVYRKKNSNNSDANVAKENDDAQNILTGTVIVSCFIKTSNLPSRVELSGNDMRLYDDSYNNNGVVTGDTATITFLNSDGTPGSFAIQHRSGKDFTEDNVMEFYFIDSPTDRFNYIFIGKKGSDELSDFTNYIELRANYQSNKIDDPANGKVIMSLSKDGVQYKNAYIALLEAEGLGGGTGGRAFMSGGGTGGGVQLAYYTSPTSDPLTTAATSYIVLDKDGIQYSQSGRVSAAGVANANKFPPNWSVAHTGTGYYTITHNMGHANFAVVATPIDNASTIAGARAINSTNFAVTVLDLTGNPTDAAFSFAVF